MQADLCLAALGSDTGGSHHVNPHLSAVFTVSSLTYGRVNPALHGLLAYASSFDQIGPLTRSVTDAALVTGNYGR